MTNYDEIIIVCKQHTADTHHDDGVVSISDFPDFSSFDIDFKHLSQEHARALLVGSSHLLAYRGMNVIIQENLIRLWDAVGKHLLDPPSLYFKETFTKPFPSELSYLRKLFVTTLKTETGEWDLVQKGALSEWQWFNATPEHPFPSHYTNPGEYFVFPLFEAVLKRYLSEYIDLSGVVKKEFRHYKIGMRCNNIGHLVTLLVNRCGNDDLIQDVKYILELIEFLYHGQDASKVIANEWRNPALHGDMNVPSSSSLILNLTLLVAVNSCTGDEWNTRFNI